MGKILEIVIMVVIISALVTGFATFTGDLYNTYNSSANTGDLTFIARSQNISSQVQNIQDTIGGSDVGAETEDVPVSVFTSWFEGMKILFSTPDTIESMTTDVANSEAFRGLIPNWFTGLIILIVTIIVIFTLLSAMGKWDL